MWEAALADVLGPGVAVLVVKTGRVGHGWAEVASGLGAKLRMIDFGKQSPWDQDRMIKALAEDREHRIHAVLAVHRESSPGIRNDLAALRATLDAAGHPAPPMPAASTASAIWANSPCIWCWAYCR